VEAIGGWDGGEGRVLGEGGGGIVVYAGGGDGGGRSFV
jgi:hypothetical protein